MSASPGPWRADLTGIYDAEGNRIAVICDGWRRDGKNLNPAVENERLILAAPDLLMALQNVVADLQHYVATHGPGPEVRLDAVHEALLKATGKGNR